MAGPVRNAAECWVEGKSPVTAGERAGQGFVEIGRYGLAIADCDEVDVLTQPPIWEVGAGERGPTDELDSAAEFPAQEGKDVGDEVIALDLFGRDTESLDDGDLFVAVHCRAQVSARRSDAMRRCSVARACSRSLSLRS